MKTATFTVVSIAVAGFVTGCTSNGDMSGFKIPDPIKEKVIKKLEEDMASTK